MSTTPRRTARREDHRLLTLGGCYVADVSDAALAGALAVSFVRSEVASGVLREVRTAAAAAHPGVVAVFAARDLDIGPMPPVLPRFAPELSPQLLARDAVRHVGEPVAMVVASTLAAAHDAAELVEVVVGRTDPVLDPDESARDERLVVPTSPSNIISTGAVGGVPHEVWEACDIVVEMEISHPRVAACPMEARGAASVWRDGRLHHWVSTQGPHGVRRSLAAVLGVGEDAVRVIAPDVGGGFGPKFSHSVEDALVAWAARRLARPCRWVETRREAMVAMHHGRAQRQRVRLGGTAAGRLIAYSLDVLQDSGAGASLGAYAPDATLRMTTGVYAFEHASGTSCSVLTNTTPVSAYRGTGRPEATVAVERAVERFARAARLDPVELRRANLVPDDAFPYTTAVGTQYDSGRYALVLDRACELAEYKARRAEQARRRTAGEPCMLGIGIGLYVESTGAGPAMEFATVTMDDAASVVVHTGSSAHGQGHETTWAAIVGGALGVDPADVCVVHGDTDVVPVGLGTFASRSTQFGASAALEASRGIVEQGRALAAHVLEAALDDIEFSGGAFSVAGSPAGAIGWARLLQDAGRAHLREEAMFTGAMTFPFGAHVATVEVDAETGAVRLLAHVAVDDAGTICDQVIAEGQVHGGIAQGVGEALFEELVHDLDGTPLTTTFADYAVPSAAELPFFLTELTETPAPSNPLGAKGIGESGIIGAVAAITNAVEDALAHLGAPDVGLPATPERVWRALRAASS